MTHREAEAAVMIYDIEDVDALYADLEEIEQPDADSTEGDEVYLAIGQYS